MSGHTNNSNPERILYSLITGKRDEPSIKEESFSLEDAMRDHGFVPENPSLELIDDDEDVEMPADETKYETATATVTSADGLASMNESGRWLLLICGVFCHFTSKCYPHD